MNTFETGKINRKNFTERSGRYAFLKRYYRKGNILDVGNLGGLYGDASQSNSSYVKFCQEAVESTIFGFDLHEPKANKDLYPNQKYGDVHDGLPYEDSFFDTVYLGELIEHLHSPGIVLQEIHRVLKKDGVLIIDTPNAYTFGKIIRFLLRRTENLGDPTHLIIYTPGSLVALLTHAGFTVSVLGEKVSSALIRFLPWTEGLGNTLVTVATKK